MGKVISKPDSSTNSLGIIICGGPGSGKGTQCEFIKDEYGVVHLSTGDMLRAAVKKGSKVGKLVEDVMSSGGLVSDDIMIQVIKDRLSQKDVKEKGFLLDGFPRTPAQAEALKNMGVKIDVCLFLEVPDDVLVGRMTGRRLDPETGTIYHLVTKPPPEEIVERLVHRSDDNEETALKRIATYTDNAALIKDTFQEQTHEVDGNDAPENVWTKVNSTLAKFNN